MRLCLGSFFLNAVMFLITFLFIYVWPFNKNCSVLFLKVKTSSKVFKFHYLNASDNSFQSEVNDHLPLSIGLCERNTQS